MIPLPPRSTLFPYTTLFRSTTGFSSRWNDCWSTRTSCCASIAIPEGRREPPIPSAIWRSEEHTSELQSHVNLVCRLLLEKKNNKQAGSCTNEKFISLLCLAP